MNKSAKEAGIPQPALRKGKRGFARRQTSAVDRPSTLASVFARRRATEQQLEAVGMDEECASGSDTMPYKVTEELGFILHAWDWSETSLLLDVLSAHYGRVFLIAKGAKRASSQYRGVLTAFCPLKFSWSGKKEAKNLLSARWQGTMMPLSGESLLSGFYINELIMKLTEREDRHPGLFGAYVDAVYELALGDRESLQPALRRFERQILTVSGWKPERTGTDKAVCYIVRDGTLFGLPFVETNYDEGAVYTPQAVEAVVEGKIRPPFLREARDMLRELIEFHLEGRNIHSRRILNELRELGKTT